ncbi:MAG: type II and III secretion system protein [Sedimentisphaerales bacterium]|nr:type II and III secretion system protein [Sedimentisphaerales bacterium]
MARKNIIKILSGCCILICTVIFCSLSTHARDVEVTVQTFTISGSIGVEGVELQGFPESVTTDSSGDYYAIVEWDWSGTIKPVKPGYTFSPVSIPYMNVQEDKPNQDYKYNAITYTISGKVGNMADVELNGLPGSPRTKSDGSYSVLVEYGWSGQIEPIKEGFEFNPPFKEVNTIKSNITQNFTPDAIKIELTGNAGVKGVEMTGLPGKIITGEDGSYKVTVEYGWSGKVMPVKEGYTFEPADTLYSNLTADQSQMFEANAQQFEISGSAGMADVKMEGLPGEVYTDSSGYYSASVDFDFSGTIKPVREGYTFKPASITHTKVRENKANQDFKPSIETYVIKGRAGRSGVKMNGLPGDPVTTGPDGAYSVTVEYGASYEVAPELEGYSFNPPNRTYTSISQNYENDNYTPAIQEFTITGNVIEPGVTLRGFPRTVTADESGNFTAQVPYNWSGKVTPVKNGYQFNPSILEFKNVVNDQVAQSFEVKVLTYTISGTLISDKRKPIEGITIISESGSTTTDDQGKFSFEVPYGWEGSIMPNPDQAGYTFNPQSYIYGEEKPAVKSNLPNQNFTAKIQMFKITDVLEPGGKPMMGVDIIANPGDIKAKTDAKGEYTIEVPYGWTGEYIFKKPGYIFTPPSKSFTDVKSDFLMGEPVGTGGPDTTRQPGETTRQPGETTRQPGETTRQPDETTRQPDETTRQPDTTQKDPAFQALLDKIAQLEKDIIEGQQQPGVRRQPGTGEVLITDKFIEDDLLGVLDILSTKANIPIYYDPEVTGLVSCDLVQVPFSKALEMILANTPYYAKKNVEDPDFPYYLIAPGKTTDTLFHKISETKRVQLDYVPASTARELLSTNYRTYVMAVADDPNSRAVVVTAPTEILNRIVYELKNHIDVKPSQVLLETRIVVLEKGDLLNLGVEWGWPTVTAGGLGASEGDLLELTGKTAWGIQLGYTPDAEFTNALNAVLNMLKVNDEAKIVSTPTLFATDNETARFQVLNEDYFMLYASGLETSLYSRQELEKIVTGTVLEITPHISDENDIMLKVAVEVSNTIAASRDLPSVTRRQASSTLRVYDGGTVAIAGLSENTNQSTTKAVPGLSQIPLIGELFKNKYNDNASQEVAIFVTASIVRETSTTNMGFVQRNAAGPQMQMNNRNMINSSLNNRNNGMNNNVSQPTSLRTPSMYENPAYMNRETDPLMGLEDTGNLNNGFDQEPVRRTSRPRISERDEFNMQLNDSINNQNRFGSGY